MDITSLATTAFEASSRLAIGTRCGKLKNANKLKEEKDDTELRKAFQDFVGQTFFGQMLSAMRKTVDKPAYLHGGRTEEVFQAQLDQVLSEKLSDASAETFSGPMYDLFKLQRREVVMTLTLEPLAETMNRPISDHSWESDLAGLLEDLTQVQEELLAVLGRKRQCMAAGDLRGMKELQPAEQALCDRLQVCHDRRGELLQEAAQDGMPTGSLGGLASLLKPHGRTGSGQGSQTGGLRMSLLQHNCLVNWVLAQKALLHASQMLEIIATGGRLQPTYGNRAGRTASGALVDQEA